MNEVATMASLHRLAESTTAAGRVWNDRFGLPASRCRERPKPWVLCTRSSSLGCGAQAWKSCSKLELHRGGVAQPLCAQELLEATYGRPLVFVSGAPEPST